MVEYSRYSISLFSTHLISKLKKGKINLSLLTQLPYNYTGNY